MTGQWIELNSKKEENDQEINSVKIDSLFFLSQKKKHKGGPDGVGFRAVQPVFQDVYFFFDLLI